MSRKNLRKWLYLTPVGTRSRGVALGSATCSEKPLRNSLLPKARKAPPRVAVKARFLPYGKGLQEWLRLAQTQLSSDSILHIPKWHTTQRRLRWSWCHSTHNCLQVVQVVDGNFWLATKTTAFTSYIYLADPSLLPAKLSCWTLLEVLHHYVCHLAKTSFYLHWWRCIWCILFRVRGSLGGTSNSLLWQKFFAMKFQNAKWLMSLMSWCCPPKGASFGPRIGRDMSLEPA